MYGTAYEIAYKHSGSSGYVSELQWDIKPLLYMGINCTFAPEKPANRWGFFIGIGIKAALPMETGTMEDRDWLSHDPYYHTAPGSLTHFSSHDNHTKAAFLINLDTGFSLPLGKCVLKFYLNLNYMYFKWEARDGYIQYGPNGHDNDSSFPFLPWEPGFPKLSINGLGISYTQHWILFNTGIGADFYLGRFIFSAAVFAGPPVCIAIDEHHKRNPAFKTIGILTSGFAVKPELNAVFLLSKNFDIGLSFSYLYIGETRGDSKYKESGSSTSIWYNDAEVAALRAFEGSLSLKYHF